MKKLFTLLVILGSGWWPLAAALRPMAACDNGCLAECRVKVSLATCQQEDAGGCRKWVRVTSGGVIDAESVLWEKDWVYIYLDKGSMIGFPAKNVIGSGHYCQQSPAGWSHSVTHAEAEARSRAGRNRWDLPAAEARSPADTQEETSGPPDEGLVFSEDHEGSQSGLLRDRMAGAEPTTDDFPLLSSEPVDLVPISRYRIRQWEPHTDFAQEDVLLSREESGSSWRYQVRAWRPKSTFAIEEVYIGRDEGVPWSRYRIREWVPKSDFARWDVYLNPDE